jgi:hypothetical protein
MNDMTVNIILAALVICVMTVAFMDEWKIIFDEAIENLEGGVCVRCGKIGKKKKENVCKDCNK